MAVVTGLWEWSGPKHRHFKALDCPVWVRGRIGVGPLRIDFGYMDSVREAGTILEFIGYRFAGIPAGPAARIIRAVAWLQMKTGKRCIDFCATKTSFTL